MSQGLIGGTVWGVLAAGFGLVAVSQLAPLPERDGMAGTASDAPVSAPAPKPATAGTTAAVDPVPEAVAGIDAPPLPTPLAQPAAPDPAPAIQADAAAPPPVAETAKAPSLIVLPEAASPDAVAVSEPAPAKPAPAPGAKFVSVEPGKSRPPASVAPASAVPPSVVAAAPATVAVPTPPAAQPALPALVSPPAAARQPAAVAAAGPPPAAPVLPASRRQTTAVVTAAPAAPVLPAMVAQVDMAAPVATARAGFQPGLIGAVEAPLSDAPPATGSLPPPPPLTPEELAILSEAGPLPADAPDPGLPEVIVLTEADEPVKPSILKKPAPLKSTPTLTAKGQVPATEPLPVDPPAPAGADVAEPDTAEPSEPAVTLPDNALPIDRFARPFDNAAGKPLFAVVLIDTGDPQLDRAALAAMPFPVTFALDPTAPEAALAASIYRAAGQEVVMLATGLPEGATASDVEVSFGAHEAALPESVAVLDMEAGGFQGDRPLSTLVVPVLAGQGRGLLSWDRGLNAAAQVARREGLRSGVIFRRLDGEGEPVAQMRRYLDRAAFKAAQDGRVIVAGETRPDTVRALLEWAVEGRASTVALAPLTAALRVE